MQYEEFTFADGTEFGSAEQGRACERFESLIRAMHTKGALPYLTGSSEGVAADLSSGMVSVIASVVGACNVTGGIPVQELLMFSHPNGGFLGVAQEFSDRGVERGDWGLFTRFVASVAINGAADMVGATHVFAVKLMFAEMSDPEGRYTTNGRAPLLKFVGWDVERGVGLRWFARVASTGNPEKPFHVIPWDKPDTTERYDWMDRLEIRPNLHLDHSELGDYVMKIMTPGVEALDCLDDDENVNPCEGYVQYLGNMLDRNHDAIDIELAMTELGLSEDAADALVEQAERVFSGMYARRVTKKGMEA